MYHEIYQLQTTGSTKKPLSETGKSLLKTRNKGINDTNGKFKAMNGWTNMKKMETDYNCCF